MANLDEWKNPEVLLKKMPTNDDKDRVRRYTNSERRLVQEQNRDDDSYGASCRVLRTFRQTGKRVTGVYGFEECAPKVVAVLIREQGRWRTISSGYQFRFPEGAVVNWWPTTGRYNFQGKKCSGKLQDDLRQAFTRKPRTRRKRKAGRDGWI